MAKRYFQRDDSTLQLTTGVAAENSYSIPSGFSNHPVAEFRTLSGEPNAEAWSGDFKGQHHVVAIGADITFSPQIMRYNSAGTLQSFFWGTGGTYTALSGVGLHPFSVNWDQPGAVSSDRFQVRLVATNSNMMATQAITLQVNTADSYAEGPWADGGEEPPPPEATVAVELNDPPDTTQAALQATAGGVAVTVTLDDPADATQAALNVEAVPTYAVPLEYTATDADRGDNDVIAMWYVLNSGDPVALPITPGVTVGGSETIDLPAGSYTLTVYAEDSAGNVGSLTRTFTVNP